MAPENEAEVASDEKGPQKSKVFKFRDPFPQGKDEVLLEEVELKPSARAWRGHKMEMGEGGKIVFEPHALSCLGMKMAGKVGEVEIVNRMSVRDMQALALMVFSFLG